MRHLSKWIAAAVMGLGLAAAGALPASAATAHHPGGPKPPRLVCHWEKIHKHHHVKWVRVCHRAGHH